MKPPKSNQEDEPRVDALRYTAYANLFRGHWYDNIGEWFTTAGAFLGLLLLVLLILALPLSLAFLIIKFALTL